MKTKLFGLTLLALSTAPALSHAADKVAHLSFDQVVAEATKSGKLDGSVKFYLAGHAPAGQVSVVNDNVSTSRKTNAFGKTTENTCNWVLQSVLIALQNEAKSAGANAVIDLVSNYDNRPYSDPQNYECHVGFLMSGVALKGKLAKVH